MLPFSREDQMRLLHRLCHLGATALVLLIAGCGETPSCCGPPPPPPGPQPPPPNSDPANQTIGPAGGTLATADGAFTLTIPAGALTSPTALSVKTVADTVPYGVGKVYQLSPVGLRFAKPVRIAIAVDSAVVGGVPVAPEGLVVALGDTAGRWVGLLDSELQTAPTASARGASLASDPRGTLVVGVGEVTIEDEELKLYVDVGAVGLLTVVSYWYVDPPSARVRVGETRDLRVLVCTREAYTDDGTRYGRIVYEAGPTSEFPPPPANCIPSARTGTWFVNGLRGGNSTVGFVATGGNGGNSAPSSLAQFLAPATVPTPSTVTVRADMLWPARQVTKKFFVPIEIYGDWRATTTWKSSGGFGLSYLNGSLDIRYLAQGSARWSSRGLPFGAVTENGGTLRTDDVTSTYKLTRVETSRSETGKCTIDINDTQITEGGLNGPPSAGPLPELWAFVISIPSDNTYVLTGGLALVPVRKTTTITTTKSCIGADPEVKTTTESIDEAAEAAQLVPALEVRSFQPGQKRFEGRLDKVDDIGQYLVTSEFTWDITRP